MRSIPRTPPNLVEPVNQAHKQARANASDAIEHAVRCGELLLEAKRQVAHGQWKKWIELNCEFAYETAKRYMKAARQKGTGVPFSTLGELYRRPQQERADDATLIGLFLDTVELPATVDFLTRCDWSGEGGLLRLADTVEIETASYCVEGYANSGSGCVVAALEKALPGLSVIVAQRINSLYAEELEHRLGNTVTEAERVDVHRRWMSTLERAA